MQKEKIFAPKFFPRTWRKIEIIRMFNGSRNASELGLYYPEGGLANRRLDRIVCEIAGILSEGTRSRAHIGDRESGAGWLFGLDDGMGDGK